MCRTSYCGNLDCRKKTWFGCGLHTKAIIGDVDPVELCSCSPRNALPQFVEPEGGPFVAWAEQKHSRVPDIVEGETAGVDSTL
ncbi:hypothetical protein JCM10212_001670 [Sporobolomyces blumeae]